MVEYEEITESKPRIITARNKVVFLPRLTHAKPGTAEYDEWMMKNDWMVSFAVPSERKEVARRLALNLEQAFIAGEDDTVREIVDLLRQMRTRPFHELLPIQRWEMHAHNLAEYAGGGEVRETIRRALEKYSGTILEAMCGHTTYFEDTPKRNVICLDFCKASLERHPCPARRRIACDLNHVSETDHLPFFKNDELDTISVCFGYKYPESIQSVMREFRRILKPGGFLSFIENPKSEYKELARRPFEPGMAQGIMQHVGFRRTSVGRLRIRQRTFSGDFFHLEGMK